jgi:SAM-dependent methyltransferase
MAYDGLQPRGVYSFSASGHSWKDLPLPLYVPNLSGSYHPAMLGMYTVHGLGDKCLLVSEGAAVKNRMASLYSEVSFVTTDLFSELQDGSTDYVWDVCRQAPAELSAIAFSSIICSALLEHVIDPTAAFINLLHLLGPDGKLYAMTHTPSFRLHRYPRDYIRFHHDYFEDLPAHIWRAHKLKIQLMEMYSYRGKVVICYARQ